MAFAALVATAGPAAGSVPWPAPEVARALDDVAASPTGPRAYARFLALLPALDALSPGDQAVALGRLAAASRAAPLLAARARLEALAHAPDGAPLGAEADALGFVTRWLAAGPDPTPDLATARDLLLAGPPPAAGAPAELGGQERVWSPIEGNGAPGATSLEHLALREAPTIVHAVAVLDSDRRTLATVRVGAAGDVALALDGRPLGVTRGLGAAVPDQLEVDVELSRGRQTLTLSLAVSASARAVAYVRVTDRAGRPLAGLRVVAPDGVTPWPPPRPPRGDRLGPNRALAALLPAARRDVRRAVEAASLRRALRLPEPVAARGAALDTALLEDLLLTPDAARLPTATLLAALAHVPREEARASILLHLAAAGRRDAPTRLALARLAAERGQLVRARLLVDEVAAEPVAADGPLVAPLAVSTRAFVDRLDQIPETGWVTWIGAGDGAAHDAVARLVADGSERTLVEAARAARELGRADVANALYAALADALPGRVAYRAAAAEALAAVGAVDDAARAYRALAARRPDLVSYALEAARLASLGGDTDDARGAVDAATRTSAWNPDLLTVAGGLYEELGDADRAAEVWERALTLRPASPDLRRSLERLRVSSAAAPAAPLWDASSPPPPPLDPDAAFEVLAEEILVEVRADGSATRHTRRALHVQRVPEDRAARTVTIGYDPSRETVQVTEARVLRGGLAVSNLTRHSRSLGESWYGLYYDHRELAIPFDDLRPGDVISVAWRVDAVGHLFPGVFGAIELLQGPIPRHRSRVAVTAPRSLALRARLDVPPALTAAGARFDATRELLPGDRERLAVTATGVPALVREAHMPGLAEVAPTWQITSFASWDELSTWYGRLVAEQQVVTPAMRAFTDGAVRAASSRAGLSTVRLERLLADAVARDVRYVALEFGVHGFKPYRTDHVWARRFGDCKDQATLLVTLLREAGVEARVALVRTRGHGRIADPLPSLALFDHAVVWLPERGLFHDPTAANFGLGELPAPDQGAQALVIAHPGDPPAELVTTPVDRPERNGVEGDYSITLGTDGAGGVLGTVAFLGVSAPPYRAQLADPDGRHERLERMLNGRYPGLRLDRFRVSDPTDLSRPVELAFDATVAELARAIGGTLQVARPGGGDGHAERLAGPARRHHPLVLGPPARHALTFRYELPPGWRAAHLPPARRAESPFGRWAVTWSADVGSVRVETELVLARDQIAPADYPAFRELLQAFDAAARPPLVLEPEARTSARGATPETTP